MSEFSDLVSMIANLKVEFHSRFRHLLNSLAALEARLCKVEAALGIEIKPWVPIEENWREKCETCKIKDSCFLRHCASYCSGVIDVSHLISMITDSEKA